MCKKKEGKTSRKSDIKDEWRFGIKLVQFLLLLYPIEREALCEKERKKERA